MQKRVFLYLVLIIVFFFAFGPNVLAQFSPDVFVIDQPVIDGTVTVSRAVINEPGWIVIHADENDAPGPVIGFSPLIAGINADVLVEVDLDGVTDTLYAMLHVDQGEVGTYEFPGTDGPVVVNDAVVTPPFMVTGFEISPLDIVDTAAADGSFETLIAAVTAADLVDTLKGEGPFTVFAPTDDAFAALPEGTIDALLADTETLANILLYHVVPGVLFSSDLGDGMEEDAVTVNDANVVIADIEAANGIIHVIDQVILPPRDDESEDVEEVGGEDEESEVGDGETEEPSDDGVSDENGTDEETDGEEMDGGDNPPEPCQKQA